MDAILILQLWPCCDSFGHRGERTYETGLICLHTAEECCLCWAVSGDEPERCWTSVIAFFALFSPIPPLSFTLMTFDTIHDCVKLLWQYCDSTMFYILVVHLDWCNSVNRAGQTPTHPHSKLSYYLMLYPLTIGRFWACQNFGVGKNWGSKKLKVVGDDLIWVIVWVSNTGWWPASWGVTVSRVAYAL